MNVKVLDLYILSIDGSLKIWYSITIQNKARKEEKHGYIYLDSIDGGIPCD